MVIAWLVTLPAAAAVGGLVMFAADAIGGSVGVLLAALVAIGFGAFIFRAARRNPVTSANVNDPVTAPKPAAPAHVGASV